MSITVTIIPEVNGTHRTYAVYGIDVGDKFRGALIDKIGSFTTYKAAEKAADQTGRKYPRIKIIETVTHTVIEGEPK